MRILSSSQVRQLLSMSECIELMRTTMLATSSGEVNLPLRAVMPVQGSDRFLAQMPGASHELGYYGSKLLSLHANNPAAGLPAIQGLVVLFDAETGKPAAILEGAEITGIRTAAVSGLATQLLAAGNASTCGVYGTGVQAASHIEAMRTVRPVEKVIVWGRNPEKAEAFVRQQKAKLDIEIMATSDPAEAAQCEVLCTVTSAEEPILLGEWINPGTHINLVGAHSLTAREADSDLVAKSVVYVDSMESLRKEGGDIMIPLEEGVIDESNIKGELGQLLAGDIEGRVEGDSDGQITIYKSHGIFMQDLYVADYLLTKAKEADLGTVIEDFQE